MPMIGSSSDSMLIGWIRYTSARHSFPTRRSSDLESAWDPIRVLSLHPQETRDHLRGEMYRGERARTTNCCVSSEDRKSTRLNSSHMSISYAVFCLKKKNRSVRISISEIR